MRAGDVCAASSVDGSGGAAADYAQKQREGRLQAIEDEAAKKRRRFA
jgi:hypothetical protein